MKKPSFPFLINYLRISGRALAKLGEKAVARSHCAQNRNILFKCPRWSFMFLLPTGQATQGTLFGGIGSAGSKADKALDSRGWVTFARSLAPKTGHFYVIEIRQDRSGQSAHWTPRRALDTLTGHFRLDSSTVSK